MPDNSVCYLAFCWKSRIHHEGHEDHEEKQFFLAFLRVLRALRGKKVLGRVVHERLSDSFLSISQEKQICPALATAPNVRNITEGYNSRTCGRVVRQRLRCARY